jgi:hypothetical protein
MAYPTAVNSQIAGAATQISQSLTAQAPALSTAFLSVAVAQAIANAAHNATAAQQQLHILAQAVTTMCVTELLADEPGFPAPQSES